MEVPIAKYKSLKFIQFTKLDIWSYAFLVGKKSTYNESFDKIFIGSILEKSKNVINIKDDEFYNRVTVKINCNGVVLRDTEKGVNIGTKMQFKVKAGQFIVSKIDARNGAFGIIPNDLDGAVVTNDFPVYDINSKVILPDFFLLLSSTNEFIKFAKSCSSGTTNRQRMDMDLFMKQEIPLPTLAEQQKIVDAYTTKIQQAQALQTQANNLEEEIEKYFLEQLGIEKGIEKVTKKGLQLFEFSTLDRWDAWVSSINSNNGNFEPIPFKSIVIGKPVYGANVKGVKIKSDTRYIRITDINESGSLNDEFVSPEIVEEKYLLNENDFLIARSGNTVGKTFLYKSKFGRAIYAGYLVKYNIDYSKIIPEYLLEYTKSYTFKNWIASNQRVAGQPNINGQEYLLAPLILPPIAIQKTIVDKITAKRNDIISIKKQIMSIESIAQQEFEKQIFN